MGNETRPRRNRHARGPALLVATLVAALALLVPLTPAAAAPVASTVVMGYTTSLNQLNGLVLRVTVQTSGPQAVGVVALTEDTVELARATLGPGSTVDFTLPAPAAGLRTITATYLGSADVLGSSTTGTFDVAESPQPNPVTGTVTVGSGPAAPVPTGSTLYSVNRLYDPLSGSINTQLEFMDLTASGDVAGFGPVTITYRPHGTNLVGSVQPDGSAHVSGLSTSLVVDLITVAGVTWVAGSGCATPAVSLSLTGAVDATGLSLTGTTSTPMPAIPSDVCDGRSAIANAVLAGPLSLDLHATGAFLPTPPAASTATATAVEVLEPSPSIGDQVTARVTVSTAGPWAPQGLVVLSGGDFTSTLTVTDGVATGGVSLNASGSVTVTASYTGYSVGITPILLPSSGSTTITVAGPPPGRPATATLTAGTNPPIALAGDTRLVDGAFDPLTGDIGPGTLWFPPSQLTVDTGFIGNVFVKTRLLQTAPMTGHVAADGTVTFSPTSLELESRGWSTTGVSWSTLTDCTYGPIPITLSGTADAGGLHLHAAPTNIPALPSSSCSGLAAFVNPRVAVAATFDAEVAGDFRRFAPSTPVDVATYFPSVAQYNQSYFVAHVGTTTDIPGGTVTFRDGPTVLGTSPVDGTGHASLVASMDEAGTRTITAAYDGDTLHGPGSDTTTVEVAAAPTGLALDGNLTVTGQDLGIGAGSQLVPASGTTGATVAGDLASSRASLWFTPTTIPLDLPGYGPAQVEVRLFQYGQLSAATIGPDGSINGLNGTFVLQVRKITTATATTTPLGCINLVLLGFDGHLDYTDVGLTTHAGGTGRIPLGICTGPGRAAIDALAGGTVTATMHAPL